jgi:hypothetical protein
MFSLYLLFLLARYWMVRPHMFSYFFIAVFLYILEYRQKRAFILPLLALLWVNIHGVVYPVMLLITLAYMAEFIIKRIKERKEIDREGLFVIVPLVLILFMVYCTPHGIHLIGTPLTPTDFASHYINELRKYSFVELSSLEFTRFLPDLRTVFVVILVLASLACIHVVFTPRRRVSHFVLFAGGVLLLMRGKRFAYEFVLLSMPVVKDALCSMAPVFASFKEEKKMLPAKIVFVCF